MTSQRFWEQVDGLIDSRRTGRHLPGARRAAQRGRQKPPMSTTSRRKFLGPLSSRSRVSGVWRKSSER